MRHALNDEPHLTFDNVNDLLLRVSVLGHATAGRQRSDHLIHRLAVCDRPTRDARTNFNCRIFSFHLHDLTVEAACLLAKAFGVSAAPLCADTFQFDATHGFSSAKTLLRVKNLQAGESPFAVVISRDAFGQMFGRDRRFTERDTQRVHFRVIADFHGRSKVIGVDGYHNYFSGFLHEHRPNPRSKGSVSRKWLG
jgi:dihydropteroate synthase